MNAPQGRIRWSNVLTIFQREVRDQVRDRRTLFMVFVLPIFLYPLLGLGTAKLAELMQEQSRKVILVGGEWLPGPGSKTPAMGQGVLDAEGPTSPPPLLNPERNGFNPALFEVPADASRLEVEVVPGDHILKNQAASRAFLKTGKADAIVMIPPDLKTRLRDLDSLSIPIYYNSADEQSQLTYLRVDRVIERWKSLIVQSRLAADRKPTGYTEPVKSRAVDVATRGEAGGSVWAKLFPFLLVLMSLTGAFYPAIDICAGEKERGTMETLLISPASRTEIVLGKFFTVMLASMATALLNLASMGLTAMQLGSQFQMPEATSGRAVALSHVMTAPSLLSTVWMLMILVPLSAFFSAICLTLAVLARSMKEGQYYMTPLYLVALPLIFATLAPGVELSALTSLIPITGVSLLLKALLVGEYGQARRFFLPVLVPLIVYGALALRWAIDQFKTEAVLFREAEHFDLKGWIRHLIRDREATPGPGQAILCFLLILLSMFFTLGWFGYSIWSIAYSQIINVLGVSVLMALLLTRDRLTTLRLKPSAPRYLALAAALALALNPLVGELRVWVEWLFPMPEVIRDYLTQMMSKIPDLGTALVLVALVPAVCEEVAFRGFILSGLERQGRTASAIVTSAFLFGFMHFLVSITQQLVNATLLGLVLGLLAVKSRSLLPGILFHLVNNGLAVLLPSLASDPSNRGWVSRLYRDASAGLYHGPLVAFASVVSAVLLVLLIRSPVPLKPVKPAADLS